MDFKIGDSIKTIFEVPTMHGKKGPRIINLGFIINVVNLSGRGGYIDEERQDMFSWYSYEFFITNSNCGVVNKIDTAYTGGLEASRILLVEKFLFLEDFENRFTEQKIRDLRDNEIMRGENEL